MRWLEMTVRQFFESDIFDDLNRKSSDHSPIILLDTLSLILIARPGSASRRLSPDKAPDDVVADIFSMMPRITEVKGCKDQKAMTITGGLSRQTPLGFQKNVRRRWTITHHANV
jgi:hypothetical protein